MWKAVLLIAILSAATNKSVANDCVPRSFGTNNIVCVCNSTYCDSTPEPKPSSPEKGTFHWYVSSRDGLRLSLSKGQMGRCQNDGSLTLNIDTSKRYQTILGFGGAFTDSAGMNIKNLSEATQDQLIRAYFDPKDGSRYTLGRIPIGGTDFSTRAYTLDDYDDDATLQHFALAPEDVEYKIPYARKAVELNPDLRFFSAAWSAPTWMKTNHKINGFGFLKTEYYQTFANYILKFIEEYKKNGVDIWGVSTGNEPFDAYIPFERLNSMGWTPELVGDWIANNLGPTLANSEYNATHIFVLDDQRLGLPWFVNEIFKNEIARNYVYGIAVHWYADILIPPVVLDQTHNNFPDKKLLMTEACEGSFPLEKKVVLGSWERGKRYILSITQYMNHWGVGWVDWNIALNKDGGPTYINNNVDSPIIVNPENDEFYKQPMYYALKHYSRFVDRGSVRIFITDTIEIKAAAFITPSNEIVVVAYNDNNEKTNVVLNDVTSEDYICLELPPHSMNTVIYNK